MNDFRAAEVRVRTRSDLVRLTKQLANDFQENPNHWENVTIDGFLEALSGWLEDADGLYKNLNKTFPEQPTWALFAEMLLAARVYE
jgi:hypothetical protein